MENLNFDVSEVTNYLESYFTQFDEVTFEYTREYGVEWGEFLPRHVLFVFIILGIITTFYTIGVFWFFIIIFRAWKSKKKQEVKDQIELLEEKYQNLIKEKTKAKRRYQILRNATFVLLVLEIVLYSVVVFNFQEVLFPELITGLLFFAIVLLVLTMWYASLLFLIGVLENRKYAKIKNNFSSLYMETLIFNEGMRRANQLIISLNELKGDLELAWKPPSVKSKPSKSSNVQPIPRPQPPRPQPKPQPQPQPQPPQPVTPIRPTPFTVVPPSSSGSNNNNIIRVDEKNNVKPFRKEIKINSNVAPKINNDNNNAGGVVDVITSLALGSDSKNAKKDAPVISNNANDHPEKANDPKQ